MSVPDFSGPARVDPEPARRKRYARAKSDGCVLTPGKLRLLTWLAQFRVLSLPQLAALGNFSHQAARKHLRSLFDSGLVRVVAIPRVLLVDTDTPNDPSLLYGSAPNIYQPTPEGMHALWEAGRVSAKFRNQAIPEYGPRNALFLAHELQIRDVRVWLALLERDKLERDRGSRLETFRQDGDASFDLSQIVERSANASGSSYRTLRPDAWFALRVATGVFVGLLEVDRGTERGVVRWREKLSGYDALFTRGSRILEERTGYRAARILVIAPTAKRRDALAEFIAKEAGDPQVRDRFWFTVRHDLCDPSVSPPRYSLLEQPIWKRANSPELIPFYAPPPPSES